MSGGDIVCARCMRPFREECALRACLPVDEHILVWREYIRRGGNAHGAISRAAIARQAHCTLRRYIVRS